MAVHVDQLFVGYAFYADDIALLILWMQLHRSNNIVPKTLPGVNYYELLATCSKYSIEVSALSENIIKQSIWNMFSYTV